MTRFDDFEVNPSDLLIGIRFRPGMWRSVFGVPGNELTDRSPALADVWGSRAHNLQERMINAYKAEDSISILASSVPPVPERTRIEKAFACMEAAHGCINVDGVARQAGMSARQFRRVCRDRAGLSPKMLAEVLRFRHASSLIRHYAGDHAGLSVDCGYFDQSHLIAEFQRFSGRTPGEVFRVR
jgi:transcriptional regulator GlxA family with amidase domain